MEYMFQQLRSPGVRRSLIFRMIRHNGGNANGHPGQFYVPQLAKANLDPWVTPQVFNNWKNYFKTGYTSSTNANVSQATENGNFAIDNEPDGTIRYSPFNRTNPMECQRIC